MKDYKTRALIGYKGVYIISNYGHIFRIKYKGSKCMMPIKARLKKNGYLEVGLRDKNNIRKFHLVHRLVGKVFVKNPLNKPQINHDDCNKQNNYYKNLKWSTAKENVQHSWDNGLNKVSLMLGNKNGKSKLSEHEVADIKNLLNKNLRVCDIVKLFPNVGYCCIKDIKNKKTWKDVAAKK